jgi:hypothetical protein
LVSFVAFQEVCTHVYYTFFLQACVVYSFNYNVLSRIEDKIIIKHIHFLVWYCTL